VGGILTCLLLIAVSPNIMKVDAPDVKPAARHLVQANALFPLENPGIVSIPAGFLFAFLGSMVGARNRRPDEEAAFEAMQFRAYTGHGVDGSVAHD